MNKNLSEKMNLVLQKEYLIITPSDPHPYLGTESVRGCYAVFIHHPQRSAVLHWDDNCCHLSLKEYVNEFLDDSILLSDCSVALVGGWKDNIESQKSGNFLCEYFQSNCKHLDLSNFLIKKSQGSLEETGFSLVYINTSTGNIVANSNWQHYAPNDKKYRGKDVENRMKNCVLLDQTHLQNNLNENSGSRIYARDKFNDLQHEQSSRLCMAVQRDDINQLVKLIDEGITHVNVCPRNTRGWTPLHYACKLGKFDAALLLIQNGGDLYKKNDANNAPIDFLTRGSFEYEKLFTAYRVVVKHCSVNKQALLSFSLFSRHKETINEKEREILSIIDDGLKTKEGISELNKMYL